MYYIGIDLGGTNIAAGIVDENFNIIKKGSVPTLSERQPEEIVKDMASLCLSLLKEADIDISDIAYAGIATPGIANRDTGCIEYANNLPFRNFAIADILKEYLPVKQVMIENDANAAAKGESIAGAAKGAKYSVMITLGTGVGGGIIIDNKVYSGFNYAGAELGHIVIKADGRPCSCGRNGCWEAYSSATALINMTKEKMEQTRDTVMWKLCDNDINRVSGKTAFSAMKQGDAAGKEVVDMYIHYLAVGLGNIINIFQPEILTIGGGICNEKEHLLNPLLEQVATEQYTRDSLRKTEIKIAKLGNDAGIIGAAALGM